MQYPSPALVESTAIELYTIAKIAAENSPHNFDQKKSCVFDELSPSGKDGWRALAKWHLEKLADAFQKPSPHQNN